MASQHKCTIEFGPAVPVGAQPAADTAGDLHGWTETWYRSVSEEDAPALVALRNLAVVRRLLLAPGWRITRIKVAQYPGSRTATRSSFTPQDGRGGGIAGNLLNVTSEEPYDAITVNVSSVSGRSRVLSMRGIPNDVVSPGSIYLAPPLWQQAFTGYAAALIQNFAIRVGTAGAAINVVNVYISTVGNAIGTRVSPIVVIPLADLPSVGLNLRISGVIGMSGINGLWKTAHTQDNIVIGGVTYAGIQLAQKRRHAVLGTYDSGGRVTPIDYTLSNVNAASPGYGTSRKTGSFSTRPRGRRSNRQL